MIKHIRTVLSLFASLSLVFLVVYVAFDGLDFFALSWSSFFASSVLSFVNSAYSILGFHITDDGLKQHPDSKIEFYGRIYFKYITILSVIHVITGLYYVILTARG